ncbi:hypothetical protein [Bifidobacterium felsineum]|uniref:Uncharacterized protein n=1 Tax=Bifidobacterium felsineum TaxID=2045440 RepID=A0A2M9HLK3_9BIFI|nr:hypothetical protein [Bifidobacterium felsineum]MBT1163218.1 hypothetical protein [Bifidobacterium felsineum]PJM77687.1 hypothetical protein CSQ86_00990 [Bifidobacterium felsineum]
MTVDLNRDAIARVAELPEVTKAAETGAALIALWPLTEAMHMDNDVKYGENLQVRVTRAFARILTGEDVTVPDAEFVYEGADVIPGRPQEIVDALLDANDAYETMGEYAQSGDASLIHAAAEALGVQWPEATDAAVRQTVASVEAEVDKAKGEDAAGLSGSAADVASRFALALAVCDALLGSVAAGADPSESDREVAKQSLPVLLYVNELREQYAIPRIFLTDEQIAELIDLRAKASDTLTATAQFVAPLAAAEWNKHHDDVLWDPAEAKKKAKEEDEKRNKEALAAKFAHVKNDNKETVEL